MTEGRTKLTALACLLGLATSAAGQAGPQDWPGFRNAAADGKYAGLSLLARTGKVKLNVTWKRKLGSGCSAVSVAGGKAVTLSTLGDADYAVALDAATGDELWRFQLGPKYAGHDGSFDGPISTPLIAEGKVFALSAFGRFVALDLATGKLAWEVDLTKEFKAKPPLYGFGSSPVFVGGKVLLQVGLPAKLLYAFDPATGKVKWSTGQDGMWYQSPAPGRVAGRDQVVVTGTSRLFGVDPASGKVLWRKAHKGFNFAGATSVNPVVADGNVFLIKDTGGELYKVDSNGGRTQVGDGWKSRAVRNTYNVPVIHGGHIYAYSSRFLTCVDLETGEAKWRERRPGDGFLTLVNGYLVIVTKRGKVALVKATAEEYEEVAFIDVFEDDLVWAVPAFAGNAAYVRSLGEIARIDVAPGAARAVAGAGGEPAGPRFTAFLKSLESSDNKRATVDSFMKGLNGPLVDGGVAHFLYRGEGKDVALACDLLGARQERPMKRVAGTDLFYATVKVPAGLRSSYFYIVDFKKTLDPGNDRRALSSIFRNEMELSFLNGGGPFEMSWFATPGWVPGAAPAERPAGKVERLTVTSKPLKGEVPIDVYTPPGYAGGTGRYPAVYLFDGATAQDYAKYIGRVDTLIRAKKLPACVVVAVRRPFNPFVGLAGLPEMFRDELVPLIDKRFRTVAKREGRTCVGGGMGAYMAAGVALPNQDTVGNVGGHGFFMFEMMRPPLEKGLTTQAKRPLRVYIEWGKFGLSNPDENWDFGGVAAETAATLKKLGHDVAGGQYAGTTDWPDWQHRIDKVLGHCLKGR